MTLPAISSLKGTGYNQLTMPKLNPQQQQLFNQVSSALGPHLGNAVSGIGQMASGGTPEQWAQLEAPALRQFGQLQGNIASRFSGMGSGARHSSGFQNTIGGAATDLAERLQGQRLGLQQNALSQLLGLYQSMIGTDTFENALLPKQKPWWQELLGSLAPGLAQAGTQFGGTAGLMKLFPMAFGMR